MTKVATKFAGKNPFEKRVNVQTDPATITISDDPINLKPGPFTKYQPLFERLKPGQCLVCEASEVNKVQHALRRFINEHGLGGRTRVVSNYAGAKPGTPAGRVWWVVE